MHSSHSSTPLCPFWIGQELGGVRHCQDGIRGAAHSELQNCFSETCGWFRRGYVHLYLQSMIETLGRCVQVFLFTVPALHFHPQPIARVPQRSVLGSVLFSFYSCGQMFGQVTGVKNTHYLWNVVALNVYSEVRRTVVNAAQCVNIFQKDQHILHKTSSPIHQPLHSP